MTGSGLARVADAARRVPELIRGLVVIAEPGRLLRAEFTRLPVPLPYRLRGSALTAYVRHGRHDLGTLADTLAAARAMPDDAARLLASLNPVALLDAGAGLGYFALAVLALVPAALRSCPSSPIRCAHWCCDVACARTRWRIAGR